MQQATQATPTQQPGPIESRLASHIRQAWSQAKQAKVEIEEEMIEALRQRNGVYDPTTLAEINKVGGSKVYIGLTEVKCRAAEAWIEDVMLPADDKAWTLKPTPIPTLPPETLTEIQQVAFQEAAMTGIDPMMRMDQIKERAEQIVREQADLAAGAMEQLCEDQLAEGGWHDAMREFITDVATFPTAIMKQVLRKSSRMTWVNGQPKVQEKVQVQFERVSPFDIYPLDTSDVDGGLLFERMLLTRKGLRAMRGVPGYSDAHIDMVLRDYGRGGAASWLWTDSERAELERKGATAGNHAPGTIEALQFWGSVSGEMLAEWGQPVGDPLAEYDIEAILIGEHLIKAVINPDPIGRRPYSIASFERTPGSFWGKAPTKMLRFVQRMVNASARAISNNSGMCSGPMVGVNVSRMPDGATLQSIVPWQQFQYTDKPGASGPPLEFFQPDSHVGELMSVFEFFYRMADDVSTIPAYSYGNAKAGGAGDTASGLSMLMGNASKGIKKVVANIDRAVERQLTILYDHNMLYAEDPAVKGDVQIIARGSTGIMQREQLQVRRNEFLIATNNPTDMAIIGVLGRAQVLREVVKTLDMPKDKVVPGDEQLIAGLTPQAQMPQPGAPATLDAAGNPVAGQDVALFNQVAQ